MVAASLMAGLALYSATMSTNTQKALKQSSNVSERNIVSSQIQHVLSNENLCGQAMRLGNGAATYNFGTSGASPQAGFVDRILAGTQALAVSQPTGNGYVITGMSLNAMAGAPALPNVNIDVGGTSVAHRQALARLVVRWQDRSPDSTRAMGPRDHEQDFVVTLQTPATGNVNQQVAIGRCYANANSGAQGSVAADICRDFGGTYNAASSQVRCSLTRLAVASTVQEVQNAYASRAGDPAGWLSVAGGIGLTKDIGRETVPFHALDLKATGDSTFFFPRMNFRAEVNPIPLGDFGRTLAGNPAARTDPSLDTNQTPAGRPRSGGATRTQFTRAGDILGMLTFAGRNVNYSDDHTAKAMNTPGGSDSAFRMVARSTGNWSSNSTPSKLYFETYDGPDSANYGVNMEIHSTGDINMRRDFSVGRNLAVAGTARLNNGASVRFNLDVDGEVRFSNQTAIYTQGPSLGNFQGYLAGHGNDIELGSHNPNVSLVTLWNRGIMVPGSPDGGNTMALQTRSVKLADKENIGQISMHAWNDPVGSYGSFTLTRTGANKEAGRMVIRSNSADNNSEVFIVDASHIAANPSRMPAAGKMLVASNDNGRVEWRETPGSGTTTRGCANPATSVAGACLYINQDGHQEFSCPAGKVMVGITTYHPPGDQGGHNWMGPICR